MRALSGYPIRTHSKSWILFVVLAIAVLWACTGDEVEGDQYLTWSLSENLASYDSVHIDLVSTLDHSVVYELVWNKKLPDPKAFPKYKLTEAKGKDFTIRIRGFDSGGKLVYNREIQVVGTDPKPPQILLNDVRLKGIKASLGELSPAFHPDVHAYSLQLPESEASVALTVSTMDAGNFLSIDEKARPFEQAVSLNLNPGANVFVLISTGKDGRHSDPYQVVVFRGEAITPDKVLSVKIAEDNIVLYAGDTATEIAATVEPLGALLTWASQNTDVVSVDGNGKVRPLKPGKTTVTVTAGSHSDEVSVEVVLGEPVLTVGPNLVVKPNVPVEFPITLTLTKANLVSFKYALEGGETWDAGDSTVQPGSLTHSYPEAKPYIARFYVADSRGNTKTVTRTINVNNSSLQVSITSPGEDTTVNVNPITVKFTVNNTPLSREVRLEERANRVTIDTVNGTDSGSSAPVIITLDTKPPKAPSVSVVSPTDKARPTWTWIAGGEGNGTFRVSPDSTKLGSAPSIVVNQYAPASDLSPGDHWLFVQERDLAGNWSPSGSAKVTIQSPDNVGPNAPKVLGAALTSAAPKWTWSTGGGGGSGYFRSKVDDSVLTTGAPESRDSALTYGGALISKKTYTLYIQERDAAGNWSPTTAYPIVYDATQPGLAIVTPLPNGTYLTKAATVTLSGTAGGGPYPIVKVSYKLNGAGGGDAVFANGAWSIANIPLTEGPTLITVTATDTQNGTATQSLTVLMDITGPDSPKLTGATPTNTAPKWTWISGGNGGTGRYRYKLDDSVLTTGATETDSLTYTLAKAPVTGTTYRLYVSERDAALNWSVPAGHAIVFDDTKPTLAILTPQPSGTFITKLATVSLTGTATGPNAIVKVTYKLGAAAQSDAVLSNGNWSISNLALAEGVPVKLVLGAIDALNRTAVDMELTLWRDNTVPSEPVLVDKPPATTVTATGTWSWIAGSDGPSGTGLSGKYRYNLNGAAFKDTTGSLLNNLALVEGNNIFSVQEEDRAGNWSISAQSVVKLDKTGPALAITTPGTNPFSQTTSKLTLSGSVSDVNSTVASVTYSLNAAAAVPAVVTGTTWTSAQLTLKQGKNDLIVTAMDALGNSTIASLTVNVAVADPVVKITYPLPNFLTNLDAVTLKYTVDDGAEITAAVACALSLEGNNTCTAVSPANEVGRTGSASVTVVRDKIVPNAPTLTAAAALTNGNPTWNFAATTDNVGGGGLATPAEYRYQLNGTGAFVNATGTTYSTTGVNDVTYSLVAQQRDKAGNWSTSTAAVVIRVDKVAPDVDVVSPLTGLVTNATSVALICKLNGNNQTAIPKTLVDGANVLTCAYTDSANNTGTKSVTVYGARNAIFVNDLASNGDGKSWTSPYNSITTAMGAWTAGKEIWIAAGNYGAPVTDGYKPVSGMSFLGGFPDNGTAYTAAMRTFAPSDSSIFSNGFGNIFTIAGASAASRVLNVTLDGIKLHYSSFDHQGAGAVVRYSTNTVFRNVLFEHYQGTARPLDLFDAAITVDKSKFTSFSYEIPMIGGSGPSASFQNCEFKGNAFSASYTVQLDLTGFTVANVTDSKFYDKMQDESLGSSNHFIRYQDDDGIATGTLNVTGCEFNSLNPPAILVPLGTKGTRTPNTFHAYNPNM